MNRFNTGIKSKNLTLGKTDKTNADKTIDNFRQTVSTWHFSIRLICQIIAARMEYILVFYCHKFWRQKKSNE